VRTAIVYESMYGNTHVVADAIATAARRHGSVEMVPVSHASPDSIGGVDLVIVGGPTHVHSMSRAMTRDAARKDVQKHPDLELDPDAEGPGLRDWFKALGPMSGTHAAAFDTRVDAPPVFTGRASKGISRRLRHHGFDEVVDPESFLVDDANHLEEGEAERATAWAESVFDRLAPSTATPAEMPR
jgi:flavodoxin